MVEKILLDTDIGSDIDDAVALAYLLAQPDCDLLGITTVTGESLGRAMLASILTYAANRPDIPIYPGSENPLLLPQMQDTAPHTAILPDWPHETEFPRHEAVEFLRRTIRQNPYEVTLLAIGPLTNIALLFAIDPETIVMLKRLVVMGGHFKVFDIQKQAEAVIAPGSVTSSTEWNARLDPHATRMVYTARVPVHRSVGLEITQRVSMQAYDVRQRFRQHELLAPVLDMAEMHFKRAPYIVFHDPLAAATIFDEGICTFERGVVEVEIDTLQPGHTRWYASPTGTHEVADTVDSKRFFASYFSVFV
jgi:purine nucleosidase